MDRRDFVKTLGLGSLSVFMHKSLNAGERFTQPPNIVFIFADDWGWGDLGCYGNRRIKTPNIDRLAHEGTLFKQFYAAAAVCSPSRASCLTGQFTARHGVHSHLNTMEGSRRRDMPMNLDPDLPMLPRLLKEAGYTTAHFGKWHLCATDDPDAPSPSRYGFDEHRITVGSGSAVHEQPFTVPGFNIWENSWPCPEWSTWRANASKRIFDETINFIEKNRKQPFYVQAWLYDTHAVLTPNEQQMEPFKNLPMPYRIYYSAVADSDSHVGRLLDKLDLWNLTENTIIIFSSDNGPEDLQLYEATAHGVGEPGPFRGRKRSGYEGGIRMPFIVRWPKGTPAGRIDEDTVLGAVDILPTLCSLAGTSLPHDVSGWQASPPHDVSGRQASPPHDVSGRQASQPDSTLLDGEDMSTAFRGKSVKRKRPLFWDLGESTLGPEINRSPKLIIRDGRWKLMMNKDGSGIELYDIVSNPLEVDNLADTHPDIVRRLSKRLLDWKNNPHAAF